LSKLPGTHAAAIDRPSIRVDLDNTLVEMLKERRGHSDKKKQRGKKLAAGQELKASTDSASTSQNNQATTSSSHVNASSNSDDTCYNCDIEFLRSSGADWVCCTMCNNWVCGTCNEGIYDPNYICPKCE